MRWKWKERKRINMNKLMERKKKTTKYLMVTKIEFDTMCTRVQCMAGWMLNGSASSFQIYNSKMYIDLGWVLKANVDWKRKKKQNKCKRGFLCSLIALEKPLSNSEHHQLIEICKLLIYRYWTWLYVFSLSLSLSFFFWFCHYFYAHFLNSVSASELKIEF